MSKVENKAVSIFKILASKTRFSLLRTIIESESKGGKLCVNDLAESINMTHSATSHQLSHLEKTGVVKSERNGQMVCYSLESSPEAKCVRAIIKSFD